MRASRCAWALVLIALVSLATSGGSGEQEHCLSGHWPQGPARAITMHGSRLVLGSGATLQVLEPDESGNPELLRELHLFDVAEDIEVSGGHAFVAEGAGGLRVIDLSDPSGLVEIASISTPGYATGVAVSGSIACIAAREQGLLIVDVGDPSQPMLLGQFVTSGTIVDVAVE